MADREVNVKLTANVSDYIAGMNAARAATRRLGLTWAGMVGISAGAGAVIGSAVTLLLTR